MAKIEQGWAWLSLDDKHQLTIETSPNRESAWIAERTPIPAIDMREHAYTSNTQNVRARINNVARKTDLPPAGSFYVGAALQDSDDDMTHHCAQ